MSDVNRPNRTSLNNAPMPDKYNPGSESDEDANVIRGMDGHNPNAESFGDSWDGEPTHSNPRFLDDTTPDESHEPPYVTSGQA